ncbi:TetR/AcrR family transcriptional regulator [Paenibacillus ginsengarvi]|uniref:TetR/AcrR family transcriptional regulator n=1 Tax=Paenibacillus ginsengarvi TaxID=400777 RepID=A0A3B0C0V5_9BACL|nr:TetR/AcrR family transcriptional regulator [Paenibacillus ginsengarvi]RKN78238.1 TetR/AcrR family transcriptional regulator [Paenibacillus ginsengarvi]
MSEAIEPWIEELLQAGLGRDKMTDKQRRIVESAIEVFAEKGYAASSTSEIAQRAGVAEGTIFRHFKTKKELLLSIVTPTMLKMIAPFLLREFRDVLTQDYDSYEQFLRAMIENRLLFLQKNKSLIKIVVQELPFHPELQEQFVQVVLVKVKERLEIVIGKFKAEGQLADLPVMTIIRLSASAIMGYVLTRTLYGTREGADWDDERELEATIGFIMKGLAP